MAETSQSIQSGQQQLYPSALSEIGSGYAPGLQQPMSGGLPLPAYSAGSATPLPATPPPNYMPGMASPYAPMGAPNLVSGDAMSYSLGPGQKDGPSPAVMYQPVASGQPQVVIINGAAPELPVSPHPAVALGKF